MIHPANDKPLLAKRGVIKSPGGIGKQTALDMDTQHLKPLCDLANRMFHSDPWRGMVAEQRPRNVSPLKNKSHFVEGQVFDDEQIRLSMANPSRNESHLSPQSLSPITSATNPDTWLETTGKVVNPFKNESHIRFIERGVENTATPAEQPRRQRAKKGKIADPNKNVSQIMPEMLPVAARPLKLPEPHYGKTLDPLRNKSQVLTLHPACCLPEVLDKTTSRLMHPSKNQPSDTTVHAGTCRKRDPQRNESHLVFADSVSATYELSPPTKLLSPERNVSHFELNSGAESGYEFSPLPRNTQATKNDSHLFDKLPIEPRVNQRLLFIGQFNKSSETTAVTGVMRRPDYPGRNDESKTCDPYRLQ